MTRRERERSRRRAEDMARLKIIGEMNYIVKKLVVMEN
jgi:hypothetical protein